MTPVTTDRLLAVLENPQPPCCSLYLATHRRFPESRQDPVRFRQLVKQLEASLKKHPQAEAMTDTLERLHELAEDSLFWKHRSNGLAILAAPDRFEVFDLQRPVPDLAIVADTFHIKPLLRIVQSADRFHILCLDRQSAWVYEGNRDALDRLELEGAPLTINEALGKELTEPHRTVASYGGLKREMHHGHGSKDEEEDKDRDRFFQIVDREVLERCSQPTGLPLVLAALPEYHTPFRRVSKNPFLVAEGIKKDPKSFEQDDELRREVWKIMEPVYLQRLQSLVERFKEARSKQHGSDDLSDVARAAVAGRVETLLVEADRQIPGRIDRSTGEIRAAELADPQVDDQLDDLAEMVLKAKGRVIVVPRDRMPTATGLAGVYRY